MATTPQKLIPLSLQILNGRWFTFFASQILMAACGAVYVYAVYSNALKSTLHYNQQQLNTIAFFKDFGANVGIITTFVSEFCPPSVILVAGALFNLSGYLMIYLSITERVATPHFWQMCLYMFLASNSQMFANTAAIVTTVNNFPSSRGIVIGMLKGFLGLSGAILTQLYLAIYGGNDPKSLVLLVVWLQPAVSLAFVRSIRFVRSGPRSSSEFRAFCAFLSLSFVLAGYLLVAIVLQKRVRFSHSAYSASAAIVVFLLFLPVVLIVREELRANARSSTENSQLGLSVTVENGAQGETPNSPIAPIDKKRHFTLQGFIEAIKPPKRGEDYSILQALFSVELYIILFGTITGLGGMLAAMDNLSQIGDALGYPASSLRTFISLISIWNFVGRVGAGFVSEILLTKYRFPRPLLYTVLMVLGCIAHLLIAFGVPGSLYVASVIVGLCFGAQVPLVYAIVSEFFGLKYYSTLFNIAGFGAPVSSYVLNVKTVGFLYDRETARQNGGQIFDAAGKPFKCIGVQCFKLSFLIVTGATIFGALMTLVLAWRTRDLYRNDVYAKFKGAGNSSSGVGDEPEERTRSSN